MTAEFIVAIARWRETRDPLLGKQIVDMREADDPAIAAIDELPAKKQAAALLDALAKKTIPHGLADAIDRFARARKFAWPVIEKLADRDPDPRWAALALGLLADFERLPPKSAKLWRRLVDAVEQHGDAAFGAALASMPLPPRTTTQTKTRLANVQKRVAKLTLVPVDDAALAIWRDALATRAMAARAAAAPPDDAADGAALLAAIHADPDDLGARAVYGDWLAAHGDPRGEFIQLQLQRTAGTLTPSGTRRESALLRKHARAWLEPLANRLHDTSEQAGRHRVAATELAVPLPRLRFVTFANGFVAQLQVTWAEGAELDAPIFATVIRALGLNGFVPTMRALREAHITSIKALASMARLPRPLVRFGMNWQGHEHIPKLRGIPELDLEGDSAGSLDWSPVLRDNPHLVTLRVRWGLPFAWGAALDPAALEGAPGLREVILTGSSGAILKLARVGATAWTEAEILDDDFFGRAYNPEMLAPLARLGPNGGPITRLVWRVRKHVAQLPERRAAEVARLAITVEVVSS